MLLHHSTDFSHVNEAIAQVLVIRQPKWSSLSHAMRRIFPSLLGRRSARLAWIRSSKSSEYQNLAVTGLSKPRYFSSSSSQDDLNSFEVTSFPETPAFSLESDPFNFTTDPNYFSDSNVPETNIALDGVDAVITAAPTEAAVSIVSELGYSPPHLVIRLIENVHLMAEIPYWETIVLTTIALRIFLLPVALYTAKSASRMAHARPKIINLQTEFQKHPNVLDPALQEEFRRKMAQLLEREQVNPARTIIFPFLQIPILISFFFGLREMTAHLPDAVNGGTLWFTDLSATDQFYIFPVLNAVSFMTMIEIGTYGVPINKDVEKFKWVSAWGCNLGGVSSLLLKQLFERCFQTFINYLQLHHIMFNNARVSSIAAIALSNLRLDEIL